MSDDETDVEYDLAEVLNGSVPDIVGKLPDLSDKELVQLNELELDGKGRNTLFQAISAEQKRRVAEASDEGGDEEGDRSADRVSTPLDTNGEGSGQAAIVHPEPEALADMQAAQAVEGEGFSSWAVVNDDDVVADLLNDEMDFADDVAVPAAAARAALQQQRDQLAEKYADDLKDEKERLAAALQAPAPKAGKGPKPPKPGKPFVIDEKAPKAAEAIAAGAVKIAFADEDLHPIAALPPLPFDAGDFQGTKLNRQIDLPIHGPAARISHVVLLDAKDAPVALVSLVAPFACGGGRAAQLPLGSLRF